MVEPDSTDVETSESYENGRLAGLRQARNWLCRNANAERRSMVTRSAFIEAANAILKMAETK